MRSHARRLLADLRRVGGWVIAIATTTLIVSILSSYMATFSVADGRSGALATTAPRDPLSFLRVIDPEESIVTRLESVDDFDSVLDEPGLAVLLDLMRHDERLFIVLDLSAFPAVVRSHMSGDAAANGVARAVIGAAPPFLPQTPSNDPVQLWGSVEAGGKSGARVSDSSIFGHAVRQVAEERLAVQYISGSGRRASTEDMAAVAFDVGTARELGVARPTYVSDVVRGFTCYCEPSELADVAEAMSEAEARAGTGRLFYAVGYDGIIGPVERSRALGETLITSHGIVTLLSVACLVAMVAQVFWARRSRAYAVERLCGAGQTAIQVRSQLLIALSLTLPALVGYELVSAVMQQSSSPPPLPSGARAFALAGAIAVHALAGAITAFRVRRLCAFPMEVHRV